MRTWLAGGLGLILIGLTGCEPPLTMEQRLAQLPETPRLRQFIEKARLHPEDPYVYQSIAYVLVQLKRERDIEPFIQQALAQNQSNPMHSKIGWIYFNAGRYRDALAQWQLAAEVSKGEADYDQYCLALGYWRTGQVLPALQQYDLAVRKDSDFAEWETLSQRVSFWTPPEKKAIEEIYIAWRKAYRESSR